MDTRQWIEPPDAPVSLLQPWAPDSSNGHNVVVPWPGYDLYCPQPQTQGFIPDAIGTSWGFGVQNLFDQNIGIVATFPPTSHLNYNECHDTIVSVTPALDIRRSLNHLVPQRRYANSRRSRSFRNFKQEPSIFFDTHSGPGFLIKDALAISLRFEFEGCDSWTCQVKTRNSRKVPHPIPREKLAHEVAKKLMVFLKMGQTKLNEMGSVSEMAVNVEDLVLVRLDHVSKASWQPQFMIVRDA